MLVPSGTRMSGPGVESLPPASRKAADVNAGPSLSSGYQFPSAASNWIDSTPFSSLPAGTRLSFAAIDGSSPAVASAANPAPSKAIVKIRRNACRGDTENDTVSLQRRAVLGILRGKFKLQEALYTAWEEDSGVSSMGNPAK